MSTDTVVPEKDAGDPTVRFHYTPLPFTSVTINDTFWAPRQQINRERTIPHIFEKCQDRIDAFRPDWDPSPEVRTRLAWGGTPVMFWDSDIAKSIEAASYSLATHPDAQLDAQLDDIIALIAGAQHPDGYLNTWFTTIDPENRWKNLRDWHELYCAGHMIEAAVAHFNATGKRTLLDVVCRYADYIGSLFGSAPEQAHGYCGHPEIELALVRLAHATGERRYMELSRYFVDERGQKPSYFDQEAIARGEDPSLFWARSHEYNQSHCPVCEQHEVVGHAVRAVYLYSAMADLAGEYGDGDLLDACRQLWQHLTTKRMYVMGGIGTSKNNEGFTSDYDLPNESAYAETCAAIGLIFWAQRMLRHDLDRRYTDVLELALYNAVISGVSLAGDTFFYDNPLASNGSHHRTAWFECPCCPPNLARLMASLGEYIYAQSDSDAVVHLYIGGTGQFTFAGEPVTLHQETRYPWDGTVTLRVEAAQPTQFGLRLRIPAWCDAPRLQVNGEGMDIAARDASGYVRIERTWQPGDTVTLELPMPVQRVYGHPAIAADVGKIALQRGPLVYCFEQIDQHAPLERILLQKDSELAIHFQPELLHGVTTITGSGVALDDTSWNATLYRTTPPTTQPCAVTAIPYYAWDERGAGAMRVWVSAE